MATLKLRIKDNEFVESNGVDVKNFTPKYVRGNFWKCAINPNGTLFAQAKVEKDGVLTTYRLIVKMTGYMKFTKKTGDEVTTLKKEFLNRNKGEMKDGTLCVFTDSQGIMEPYAYFRNEKFQSFLDNYHIDSVSRRKRGDFIFKIRNCHKKNKDIVSNIYSDGELEKVRERKFDFPNGKDYNDTISEYVARDATFVITEINGVRHLYADVEDVEDLDLSKAFNS